MVNGLSLLHKGIDFEYRPINLLKNEQNAVEYKQQVNPNGSVPALVWNGDILTQSLAILEFLEEVHPEQPLLPKDPILRAKVRSIAALIACDIQPVQNLAVLNKIEKLGGVKSEWGSEVITKGFVVLEKVLERTAGKYCVGDQLTIADLCLVPQCYNAGRFNVDMAPFPTIARINEELGKMDLFKKAHPSAQPDAQN
ncbi:Glutathione S-transferase zeta-1 [Chytridiales sp. JEL 0842]|nr:Glutathione S-transferase zeta-1 [Chytridiales sp. JEL 0842]